MAGFFVAPSQGWKMEFVLWHNPRCSKSRAALGLLRGRGIEPAIRDYLRDAPTPAELRDLLVALRLPARQLVRSGEPAFAQLGLDGADAGEDALVAAMAAHPQLIERPVFIAGQRAVIGRPPERMLDLL